MKRRRSGFVILRKDRGLWWVCRPDGLRVGGEMAYSSEAQVELALVAAGLERASATAAYGSLPGCFSFWTREIGG